MNLLHILKETFTNGYSVSIVDILSLAAVFAAIYVIVTKNPIVSVLFLIGLFLCIASYLISIGITFIGLSYLLVYVGAVSILFLFILMLINIRVSELLSETRNSIPLVSVIALSFSSPLSETLPFNATSDYVYSTFLGVIFRIFQDHRASFLSTSIWDGNIMETSHITSIGSIMYTNYAI